ncbi:MAG TPA: hypothetical protein VG370_33425 [Chloroflexota bacterium]|nr:hypothetical protein [Chloroflexota bacterium]
MPTRRRVLACPWCGATGPARCSFPRAATEDGWQHGHVRRVCRACGHRARSWMFRAAAPERPAVPAR